MIRINTFAETEQTTMSVDLYRTAKIKLELRVDTAGSLQNPLLEAGSILDYVNWLRTFDYIQLQMLNNPSKYGTLRGNTREIEAAWTNIGKMFGFIVRAQVERGRLDQVKIRAREECMNMKCAGVDGTVVCGGCMEARYCGRVSQNV